jgi:hypothetical protein
MSKNYNIEQPRRATTTPIGNDGKEPKLSNHNEMKNRIIDYQGHQWEAPCKAPTSLSPRGMKKARK